MVKVLIADDSAVVRSMVSQVLSEDPRFQLVGAAETGLKAVSLNKETNPDLIIMDITMPQMDGIEATREILKTSNPAIIAFTTDDNSSTSYKCLEAGIIDIEHKPNLATMSRQMVIKFCDKLFEIAVSYSNGHIHRFTPVQKKRTQEIKKTETFSRKPLNRSFSLVLIGASTGGPVAIQKLLSSLDPSFPLPILITQHIDGSFDQQLAKWLSTTTRIPVSTAQSGIQIEPGHAYIAPSTHHLKIRRHSSRNSDTKFVSMLDDSAEMNFLKPSVDKMFLECADVAGNEIIAVILTGMGNDGTQGLLKIKSKGGYTIAQDRKTCVVFGMPKSAIEAGAIDEVLSLDQIGHRLSILAKKQGH